MRIFDKIMNNYSVKTRIPFPIFDVYYFRWNPFCRTGIHDHAPSGCVSILLKGGLNERLYDKDLNFIKENDYKAPNISFINDKKRLSFCKVNRVVIITTFLLPQKPYNKRIQKKIII